MTEARHSKTKMKWSDEVQAMPGKRKKRCKLLQKTKEQQDYEKYETAKKETKEVVVEAKSKAP